MLICLIILFFFCNSLLQRRHIALGSCTKDDTMIFVKCVLKSSDELHILRYLTSTEMMSPRDHTIKPLRILEIDNEALIVMPYLKTLSKLENIDMNTWNLICVQLLEVNRF